MGDYGWNIKTGVTFASFGLHGNSSPLAQLNMYAGVFAVDLDVPMGFYNWAIGAKYFKQSLHEIYQSANPNTLIKCVVDTPHRPPSPDDPPYRPYMVPFFTFVS